MKDLSLYIHIPFCIRKCEYCDFLSFAAEEKTIATYFEMLKMEIQAWSKAVGKDYLVKTVFLGGGTPSVPNSACIVDVLQTIKDAFQVDEKAEISLEMNPGTVTLSKLQDYYRAGVNRVSIGLQSANEQELQKLGRIHTYEQFLECYHLARQVGFARINIDIMSALPGQTMESYSKTLEQVIALGPEHISAYSLILEEGTPFYEKQDLLQLPGEDLDRELYEYTGSRLAAAGYKRYEISNYAKPGEACRHNMVYWQGGAYLGLGLGASSYLFFEENMDGRPSAASETNHEVSYHRWRNPHRMEAYLSYVAVAETNVRNAMEQYCEENVLETKDRMEEFMFLGLRMMDGVSPKAFQDLFHKSVETVYGKVLENLEQQELIARTQDYIRLTPYGIDVSNYVFSQFLLD